MSDDLFFQPSPEQRAFFDFVEQTDDNAVLEACAGSGKTTTLLHGTARLRGTSYLGAYNKDIAKELSRRVKTEHRSRHSVHAGTLHSAGLTTWRQRYPKAELEKDKPAKVFRKLAEQRRIRLSRLYMDYVESMVGYAMSSGIGLEDRHEIDDDKRWKEISAHYNADRLLENDKGVKLSEDTGIALARMTLVACLDLCPKIISFDEMLYAPLWAGLTPQRYDNVLIDEAQDCSVPRILLAERMLAEHGRLIAVGDRHQSIYGFAGADPEAMENIIDRFDCELLPLSVSFRCPRAVVLYAQQFVGEHIMPADTAPEGIARRIAAGAGWWRGENPGEEDAVLCRFNLPLVRLAYSLLREGVPSKLAGKKDLGVELRKLARLGGAGTIDEIDAKLDSWLSEEITIARRRKRPEREETARDLVETIRVVMDRCREMGARMATDVEAELARLFASEDTRALLLSSIHKAKGKEWPKVFWMQSQPWWSSQEWQRQQETNLNYVAATRAKRELVLVQ
jgi:DNA helicase II / ATP-dependent DNA helicase PcrA